MCTWAALVRGSLIATFTLSTSAALANIDPPGIYDARAAAIGGTGVAYTFNGASNYQNPATLQGIPEMALSASVLLSLTELEGPLNGPNTEPVQSNFSANPLFFLGGGYRLNDQIVIGFAAYPTAGAGATYEKVQSLGGADLKSSIFSIELTPNVSIAILKNLWAGLGYRINYVNQSATSVQLVPGPDGTPTPASFQADLTGWSFLGLQAGFYYQPVKQLDLGFVYRSRVTTGVSGTTSIGGGAGLDTESSFSTPHGFRLGSALHLLEDRLMLALDAKYLLYSQSSKSLVNTITTPVGKQLAVNKLDWKNTITVGAGAEYLVTPQFPIRAGYNISTSATPDTRPSPFLPSSGLQHDFLGGLGLILEHWNLDLTVSYAFSADSVSDPIPPAVAGDYRIDLITFGTSVTYRR